MEGKKRVLRRNSRIVALKTLFYYLERKEVVPLEDCFEDVSREVKEEDLPFLEDFAWELAQVAVKHLSKIKVIIRSLASEYRFEKIAPINRVLLVLGVAEMKFLDTPPVVVINEYVELAKIFGEDKSAALVNGVLDNYRKSLGLERTK